MARFRRTLAAAFLLVFLTVSSHRPGLAQTPPAAEPRAYPRAESLGLSPAATSNLHLALERRDYVAAEAQLIDAISHDPHSTQAAKLLAFLGGVYFLNSDYGNAAIAWNKSDAILGLEPAVRFSLAMAYVHLGRSDWARNALLVLVKTDASQALYPYWLGRLDYDAHLYPSAVEHFQKAVSLDPHMAKAYDNLGLCLFYMNDNERAMQAFHTAIQLDRSSQHPSAWPYLDLAVAQEFTGQLGEAVTSLHQAIALDPALAAAHFELGNALERQDRIPQAVGEFEQAARLNPRYAEPHFALARLYRKQGQAARSLQQVKIFKELHEAAATEPARAQP